MIKVTTVDKIGCESQAIAVTVNEHGYIVVPDVKDVVAYKIYAPMRGFETVGPWYLAKEVKYKEVRRARFTIAAIFSDVQLLPEFSPDREGVDSFETNWQNAYKHFRFESLPSDITPSKLVSLFDFSEFTDDLDFFDHADEIG